MCHRRAPGRSAPERPGADGRRDTAGRRLRARRRAAGPAGCGHRVPVRLRGRHREPADGGHAGERAQRAGQCGARAGNHRPGRLPGGDGRAYRGHRHGPARGRRRGQPARRRAPDRAGPDRDRDLRLRGRHRRWRGDAAGRAAGPHGGLGRGAGRGRRGGERDRARPAGAPPERPARHGHEDGAVSRLPHRHAGAVHEPDVGGRRAPR